MKKKALASGFGTTSSLADWRGLASRLTTGTVKFFNSTKGFGFITPEDGSKDIFVHISAVERSDLGYLTDGQKVSFDVQEDTRGLKAVNLQAA